VIDDDDDLESEEARTPGWTAVVYRWLLGIGGVAALVFGGVYVVYSLGGGVAAPHQGGVPLIRAAQGPVKVRPEKPGGLKVPHQDLGIYRKSSPGKPVEDLFAPEKPVPAAKTAARPKDSAVAAAGPACRPVPTLLADAGHYRRTASRLAATKLAATKLAASKPTAAKPVAAKPAAAKKAASASRASQPNRVVPKVAPIAAKASAGVRKPAAKSRRTAKAVSFRIQLGAFRTLAKARNHGQGLKRQHRSLLGRLDMVVERVDLGAKGIFYRLRAGPIANKQTARSLCRTLGKRRINCFLVSG